MRTSPRAPASAPVEPPDLASLEDEHASLVYALASVAAEPSPATRANLRLRLAEIEAQLVAARLAPRLVSAEVEPAPPPGVSRLGLAPDGRTVTLDGAPGRAADRRVTISSAEGRVLVALALGRAHGVEGRALEGALRRLRDALGLGAIGGRGRGAWLAERWQVSPALRAAWERCYARRSRRAR
jgi:hypothetical protein